MFPEYGQLALNFALFLSICLAVIPLVGSLTGKVIWMASARSLATAVFVFVGIAYAVLTWAFYTDDFSVAYVAQNSNSLLPTIYKICAVWGGHEGSLLLWVFTLASWTFAVSCFSRAMPLDLVARILSVLGMISVGFLSFMLFTSNPFERVLPNIPMDGSDLNPLLQDPGFVIHPPMLYMGYVGFSVVFAFAIAALIGGRIDSAWARWARPWTNVAWAFLGVGIMLGSWWAYYELGWGGWWFWDPVENASFMPWLAGTALIHCLAMTEKRGVFVNWTLLLAILAFSLSLLGTFLVRSGVLTSVHAFASDPSRGMFILGFLAVAVGGSLTLYALRAPELKSEAGFEVVSRESFMLFNSLIFVLACAFVLLGTLFPLIADALDLGKYSVGEPYFNLFFPPMMALVGCLLGVGVMLNWKRGRIERSVFWQAGAASLSLFLAILLPSIYGDTFSIGAALTIFVGSWVIFASIIDYIRRCAQSGRAGFRFQRFTASYWGMMIAHAGFGVCLLGAGIDSIYAEQRDLRVRAGTAVEVGGYQFELLEVTRVRGPNYWADRGQFVVSRNGEQIATMQPEKRRYFSGGNMMTEAAIDAGLFRDLYVSLGDKINNSDYAVRIYMKPLVRWIWLGALLMSIGGVIAIADKRYRRVKVVGDKAVRVAPVTGNAS
ncbi:heme lyase CcmF/NrfE family subunit [Agaribacterium haliotis]|uniref:heme lyase CcmF/NrfE family subunit n=1 Tax=Agaribacterium haliotis TaxID=2013869 RepID=UPI000BB554A6|nr:heme lyase CcmF/NrfE family subunit [Agaribacterium haliotis]